MSKIGADHLVPFHAVDVFAVQVDAAVEDCRLTRLVKRQDSALTSKMFFLVCFDSKVFR